MTPIIDVLLVLIIIFMVITPIASRGINALVPQPSTSDPPPGARHDIVISVAANGQVSLNQESLDLAGLEARLAELFKTGALAVVFVRGEKDLPFADIARVLDVAHTAGVSRIGLMTRDFGLLPRAAPSEPVRLQ
jgi:biopolymer transport protein ExbD